MIRIALAFLLAVCLFPTFLPASAETKPAAPVPEVIDPRIKAQLDRELPEISFNGNSFGDVIDFLRDVSGANIYVNWKTMEDAGVTKDVPITATLRNISFKKALDVVLEDAGGATAKLQITIDGGVISIAPAAGARRVTRSYDVNDLIPESAPTPPFHGPAIVPGLEKPAPGRAEELIKLLTTSVTPSTWKSNGGSIGSVNEAGGKLVVTQTVENQDAVANWLESLRAIVKNAKK